VNQRGRERALLIVGSSMVVAGLLGGGWVCSDLQAGLELPRFSERRAFLHASSWLLIPGGVLVVLLRAAIARNWIQLIISTMMSALVLSLFAIVDILLVHRMLTGASGRENADIHQLDDRLGWRHRPGSTARAVLVGSFDVQYEIDDDGFKRVPNRGVARRRIFIFGDSYAFGHGVENSETFANLMATSHLAEDVHVHNAAVSAYGITQMYALFLELEGRIRTGDLVIFAPIAQDLRRDLKDLRHVGLMLYHQPGEERPAGFPLYRDDGLVVVATDDWWLEVKSYFFIGRHTDRIFRILYRVIAAPDSIEDSLEMVDDAGRRARERGADFALIFLPQTRELRTGEPLEDLSLFDSLDIWPHFPAGEPARALRFKGDSHWTAEGHAIAAEAVVTVLSEQGLLTEEDLRPPAGGDTKAMPPAM